MRVFIFLFLIAFTGISFGQKAESPYLKVVTKNANIPLQSTKANVQIVGTIAQVQITQTYQNLGDNPIEASYVFPMSTQAAVHNMQMTIGNRIIKAEVFEKKKAEKIYKKAIKEGKRAAKLDQHRPNVFKMKVGNILPNETITIDVFYTEMIAPVNKEYQFVFPSVVGPRFTGESTKNETVFNQPYTKKGIADTYKFNIDVNINAGMIIQNISSNSHKVHVNYPDATSAEITLSAENLNPSNRDFILNYSLRSSKINSGLLLFEGEKENFFSLLIEPTLQVTSKEIPAREYLFVVDVSGSMMGYPIEVSKSLLRSLLSDLRLNDRFNILLFSADNTVFKQQSVVANQENLEEAIQFLSGSYNNYGGGTRLLNALKTGYKMPRSIKNVAKNVIVITDGYISVEKDVFQFIEQNLNKANVFTFGIGSGINRYLIEGMSRVSNSASFVATTKQEAYKVAKEFKNYIASPLLTQIELQTNGLEIYDIEPKTIPDVFANRPILVYGKYKGNPKGNITIKGYQANKQYNETINITSGKKSKQNEALKYLWARKKIERLIDYKKNFGEDVKNEVIKLGLQYNLATEFTSFVAVDYEVINKKGKLQKVKQPLPLPKNVNKTAVGAAASIKGKSKFKKSFSIIIASTISSSKKRAIKMWLKSKYSTIINQYLKKYKQIKIHIDAGGKIVKIEKKENNKWVVGRDFKKHIQLLPNNLITNKNLVITLKQ
ncbi:MAG: VWA domain-containing protein [Flavobacteriaceae bacterium]|nr:VWA domain-containing protein [Flavobacteriaceae bacterium]